MKKILVALLLFTAELGAQPVNSSLLHGSWPASWITCPRVPQRDYGVYHFRKTFSLDSKPERFIVHVSADNRYRLFVNGRQVCAGPSRGDLYNWYFETVDIASYLQSGNNTIAALVWNMGVYAPVAQVTNQTAFVLQGDGEKEKSVNTNSSWKVLQDTAYHPCSTDNGARMRSYMVIGPGDELNASAYPWGWESADFSDAGWQQAARIAGAVPAGYGSDNLWTLAPRNIPLMFEKEQRIGSVRRADGIAADPAFLRGTKPLVIPADQTVSILLDQSYNTVAYPQLVTSRGKGASVKLTYAEALYTKDNRKLNRNEVDNKTIIGNYDVFLPDGGDKRSFRPLWFRTYRYMQLDIVTKSEPLVLEDLYGIATGYPFEVKASFRSNDASLQQVWDIGWRTAQLCAGETYFDCPYYEQLQYEGDTRIQSLISLYVTGDDRLMRKALLDFYHSRVPEGLTQGRYPSSRLQVIPPFSLFWVSMIHDYWMHRKDEKFVSGFLHAAQGVLDWFEKKIDPSKQMLGPMPWWSFVDWNHAFPGGTPDGAMDGHSAIITLQYVNTLQQAAELFTAYGRTADAAHYTQLAATLREATYRQCFDAAKGVMANTPLKKTFSQHASIMGVITGAIPEAARKKVMEKVLYDTSLSQATFYYRFYLNRALKKAGMASLYYSQLTPWRDMIANGLTTFAENPDPTRSDCHAWSASPNYDFLATICGIVPASPGFATVRIEPAMGELQTAEGKMPHPLGEIEVSLTRKGKTGVEASVTLPQNLRGTFVWRGKSVVLNGGKQKISL
ncbi:alpha-L-rhamnosidase-related protein [Sediminibacterium soli]|uniref:alpha-L-rhamnosidase-related protein n=1 Tax=Sediminibacterium soli TaxID=2698829 RepID=UPI001379494D|nr:alpha-L-rhamnosidase C-terminal domain-containing protein [Sediminibacterium soli]NCI46825.1 alpha-L-rhamnosidase [Sediminibacterium soli]